MRKYAVLLLSLLAAITHAVEPTIAVTSAAQRYPWNGMVDFTFEIAGENDVQYKVSFSAKDLNGGTNLPMRTVCRPNGTSVALTNRLAVGTYEWTWNAALDLPNGFSSERIKLEVNVVTDPLYMVIDLSGGSNAMKYPVSYLDAVPSGGWSDVYKTTKIVLRRIRKGSFVMGSPDGEEGRYREDEVQHKVTLSKDFYIGVFEVTQKQYTLIMGKSLSWSSDYGMGDSYPTYLVSYNDLRGPTQGAKWPPSTSVDDSSFMGVIRKRTGLVLLDLPTEAQWEYACRAGSVDMFAGTGAIATMGWYDNNSGGKCHIVGGKNANAWGLFDMHGNVQEWTRDWFSHPSDVAVVDPAPDNSHAEGCRVRRGGSWYDSANGCRSADRNHNSIADAWNSFPNHTSKALGFRLSLIVD